MIIAEPRTPKRSHWGLVLAAAKTKNVEEHKELVAMSQEKCRHWRMITAAFVTGIIVLAATHAGWAQRVASPENIRGVLTVEKVSVSDGRLSGEVRSRGPYVVRDAQLLIRYIWLWDDERNPGKNDPSTSTYYTLPSEIRPGGSEPFTFFPSPAPAQVTGGRYQVSVTVAGFTEVIPQSN